MNTFRSMIEQVTDLAAAARKKERDDALTQKLADLPMVTAAGALRRRFRSEPEARS